MRDMSHITAEDIAFRLAPCLNAPGRLNEHGASLSLILLIEDDAWIAYDLAAKVHAQNESRKELQNLCYEAVRAEAEERIAHNDKVLVILAKEAPSGIAGLLAGNLKEEFGRPAIVFCPKEDLNGSVHWTGSARSIEAFHMLDSIEHCGEYLLRFGGHKLAAGLTIESDEALLNSFREAINQIAENLSESDFETTMLWDIELDESELSDNLFSEMELLEPYGANAPRPTIKVRITLSEGESYTFLGANNSHVKMFANGFTLIGFSLADKYIEEELPGVITAYGNISYNSYRGNLTKQISLIDFDAA
jgi:single-stranded-DNA-specific exonuclease